MARNNFSGTIPNSLGDLASLVTLDLSSNNLTGLISMSLEKLKPEMFIAKKPIDEMFKEGLNMNNFEKKLLNVVDQRLINHYEYSTQNFSSDSHSGGSGDISYSDRSNTYKAEECIAAAMRIGLSCVAHHPKDTLATREALSKLLIIVGVIPAVNL
ncbi:LRR receptor kinase SERK2-like [Vicia villosa]|uniref:LRR receptor kinase SERK2-like n=1 Tax=Vicia villosa TaxID=3911 RepID=UPI00273CB4E0|nr:LRR receptor kinase SERK2-like [Vicia villosa]